MKPILLRLRDFKSFRGTHRFRFAGGTPGLYFVTGDNLVRPRLGANGVGKSSLFDAVIWCLTGRTARGLLSPNVANWDEGGGCEVTFKFSIGNQLYKLVRSWHPNKLALEGADGERVVTQDDIDTLIGIDGELLCHGMYVSQIANQTFFDLSAGDKQAVFTRLMKLMRWTDSAKRAAEDAGALEQQAEILKGKADVADQSAAAAHSAYREQRRAEKKFDAERQNRLAEIDEEIATAKAEHAKLDRAILKLTARKKKVEAGRADLDRVYSAQTVELRGAERKLEKLVENAATVRATRDQYQEQWHHMDKLGPFCTECQQAVDDAHRAKHIRVAKKNWTVANQEAAFADSAAGKARKTVKSVATQQDQTVALLEAARDELAGIEARGADFVYQARGHMTRIEDLETERARVTDQENTHSALARSAKSMRDGLVEQVAALRSE